MRIQMKKIGENKVFDVEAQPTDTVRVLKEKVRAKMRGILATDVIHLIYGGEWLQDNRKLKEIGIDGRYFVGVDVANKAGRSTSIATLRPGLQPKHVDSVSLNPSFFTTSQMQVIEGEPQTEDIFEIYRYLTTKYYRCSGKKPPSAEDRKYAATWSFTANDLSDIDALVEMGFRRSLVVQAFVACEKSILAAVNVLLQMEE